MASAARSKYRLERVKLNDTWDTLVTVSREATGFLTSTFLNAVPVTKHAYFCFKGQELMAGLLLAVSKDGRNATGHDFIIYDGLFYRELSHLNRAQATSERFKIQEFVAGELLCMYEGIRISLHPFIDDIRPFLWVNYGQPGPKYRMELRYTSYVDISDFRPGTELDALALYRNASVARRQEVRYARRDRVVTTSSGDSARFAEFYRMTMQRQGIDVESSALTAMQGLIDALRVSGKVMMFESANAQGRVGSMAVFLLDERRAYYLYGANDPEMRDQHTGTAVVWEAFYALRKAGYIEVDLEGVNSPRRGWFKLSMGGDLRPYYEITKIVEN